MNSPLLENFLREEATEHVRQLLKRHLSECQAGAASSSIEWLHGPVPVGRRMFEVAGAETVELAQQNGLQPVLNVQTESIQALNRAAGVTWTRLAFRHSE